MLQEINFVLNGVVVNDYPGPIFIQASVLGKYDGSQNINLMFDIGLVKPT